MSKNIREKLIGDGLKLHDAIKTSSITASDFCEKMGIVKQTLYNYYAKEVLSETIKKKAAVS